MANTAEQMEVFGYTPEGLDQEVEKYTGEVKKDFEENKLEEERRANHPLNNVPFFQRPVNASTDDIEVPTSDPDVRAFKNKFGETYTIATSPDQRVEREKLRDGIISSLEGVKGYLENPFLPDKEQVVDFVKGAAIGTLEQIKQSMESGATYGDIFGTLAGVGAASTPFKVPKGSLRLFGGVSMEGAAKDKNLKKAIGLLKDSDFYKFNRPASEEGGISYDLNKKIWSQTGWYVDPADGQWRYFIDDTKASLKNLDQVSNLDVSPDARNPSIFKNVKISNVFDHPEFYKRYPEFKDLEVRFFNADSKKGENFKLLGSYDEARGILSINLGAHAHRAMFDGKFVTHADSLKKTLLHELQHVIQRKENFIRGATADAIPPDLVYDKDRELRGKKKPIQKKFDEIKSEFDRTDNRLKEARKAAGENPLPGLTIQQEIEIYNKHYSEPDKLRPDVTWASTAREYGVPVSVVQKAAGRTNLIGRLNKKLTEQGKVYNKLADEVYDVDRERSRIETNFYEGAGGEIEARLTEVMLDPPMTSSQLESGATAKDVFPLDARADMLEREGNLYEYQGKYGVDPFNYEVKPRKEPESTNFIDTVKKKFGRSDMMIGSGGRSYQTKNLDEARRLKKEGAFPEEIEAKTGRVETAPTSAYRDLNTLGVIKPIFKYEIDDSQAKLNGSYKTTQGIKSVRDASLQNPAFIGQVLDHPLLFEEYPELAKVKFAFKDLPYQRGVQIRYPESIIVLDNSLKNLPINDPKLRETFFHELQHAAQFIDFQKTYIMMTATDPKYLAKLTANPSVAKDQLSTAVLKKLSKNKKLKKIKEDILNIYLKHGTSIESGSNPKLAKKLATKMKALDAELYNEYLKQGNEIESRVVGKRAKFLGKKPDELASTAVGKESKVSFKQRINLLNLISDDSLLGKKQPDKNLVKKGLNFAKYALGIDKNLENYSFAKGGTVMNKQMQMAFMNEGGLTDDGMDVDPVSGNDIPAGSMAEEVRDDIPAQLSDGEYVVPADVVRYYGVKFFEDLRERAKMGLADMEANGRIGGEPVPEGGPMNTEELSPEEMQAIQEIMGMSQGGAIGQFKQQQEVLEQPPAKAVGNPVMMANGGDVESNILGGKTAAQVEQDMLAQGNAAMNSNFTGFGLGSTIFDPVNTNTGVQQTEVKPFTPLVLYNTAGQTRTVNSEEEKSKAMSEGYTMTLDEYNMYRSKRGGSGGAGRGSGIITPPGQEDKENKPWGEGTDWNNEDSIREFVKNAQEGNIQGASGRFLRGAGFALLGLPGAMLVGAFQTFQAKQTLADMQTAKEIARANGFPELEKEIEGNINTYLKTAGDAVNFINDVFGPGTSQSDRFAKTQGFDTFEDYEAAQEDMRAKAEIVKKKTPSFKGLKSTYTKKTDKPYVKVDKDGKTISKTSSTKPGATPSVTPKGDLDVAKEQEKYEGGPGFRNKGGLMTKNKKAKK